MLNAKSERQTFGLKRQKVSEMLKLFTEEYTRYKYKYKYK